ncbi:uncharacterized protein LOC132791194 isoform X1 [Drosophila nasuta]|uniref:uncharacterized protein LOC132791194 isoform X1 n=1 Tax=Drosophila nasuta TaxID=42062 RepID=UPI00295ECB14|nr:uncharacterized protein LOC132791194 isoform X1 [Drosophila nasuta]
MSCCHNNNSNNHNNCISNKAATTTTSERGIQATPKRPHLHKSQSLASLSRPYTDNTATATATASNHSTTQQQQQLDSNFVAIFRSTFKLIAC